MLLYVECWQAVGRLGGTNMLEECKKLRTNIFEPSIVPWNIRGKDQNLRPTILFLCWKIKDDNINLIQNTKSSKQDVRTNN